ncbi:alpha-ketoglutarate-dependent dioxygenase AlkB, partial [Tanacetum coccineum]
VSLGTLLSGARIISDGMLQVAAECGLEQTYCDLLGGHLDDMKVDWSKQIVSMSLGCKAIFLLGRKSRNDEPASLAMFLRSGDIVLMSGEAREHFHGVPRIFTDAEHVEMVSLEKQLSDEDDIYGVLVDVKTNLIGSLG